MLLNFVFVVITESECPTNSFPIFGLLDGGRKIPRKAKPNKRIWSAEEDQEILLAESFKLMVIKI